MWLACPKKEDTSVDEDIVLAVGRRLRLGEEIGEGTVEVTIPDPTYDSCSMATISFSREISFGGGH